MEQGERSVSPSMGSSELDPKTSEQRGSSMPEGLNIQTRIAAISAQKKKEEEGEEQKRDISDLNVENINDDERVVKNVKGENEFLENGETDEG